jgi:tetratricopeptide (TPR) repeat protein
MLVELGEYPETLVWADKALELFPEHPELLAEKAIASLRDGKIEDARAYSDNSISKDRIGPRVWLARAEVLLEGKSRIAEDCLSKALARAGEEADLIRLETGRLLRRYQRYSAAVGHLQEAACVFPKSALAWYELGLCQTRLGLPQGKMSLEQCLHLRPHWKAAQDALKQAQSSGLFRRLFEKLRMG